jgi:hypothetical protein
MAFIALVALIPAAFNPAPAAAAGSATGSAIVVPLCSGALLGAAGTIPLRPALPPARDGQGCCAKGCHAGSSRKRGNCHN